MHSGSHLGSHLHYTHNVSGDPPPVVVKNKKKAVTVDRSSDNPKASGDYSSCVPDSVGACPSAMHKGLPRRSWACPAALRGVLKGEAASATTAPKCTKVQARNKPRRQQFWRRDLDRRGKHRPGYRQRSNRGPHGNIISHTAHRTPAKREGRA